jgi:hypothetical protein
VARALALIHRDVARAWTVDDLDECPHPTRLDTLGTSRVLWVGPAAFPVTRKDFRGGGNRNFSRTLVIAISADEQAAIP